MKIVILVDSGTLEQRNAITAFVKAQGVAYWHWFPDAWLISTNNSINLREWRDEIKTLTPALNLLLFTFEDTTNWSVRGNAGSFEWLKKHF
jgi:hypothetical protein